jgi:hypothetical protein
MLITKNATETFDWKISSADVWRKRSNLDGEIVVVVKIGVSHTGADWIHMGLNVTPLTRSTHVAAVALDSNEARVCVEFSDNSDVPAGIGKTMTCPFLNLHTSIRRGYAQFMNMAAS